MVVGLGTAPTGGVLGSQPGLEKPRAPLGQASPHLALSLGTSEPLVPAFSLKPVPKGWTLLWDVGQLCVRSRQDHHGLGLPDFPQQLREEGTRLCP